MITAALRHCWYHDKVQVVLLLSQYHCQCWMNKSQRTRVNNGLRSHNLLWTKMIKSHPVQTVFRAIIVTSAILIYYSSERFSTTVLVNDVWLLLSSMGQVHSCFISGFGHVIYLISRIAVNSYLQAVQCITFNMHYIMVCLTDAIGLVAAAFGLVALQLVSTQVSTVTIHLLSTICIINTPHYIGHLFLLSNQLLLKFVIS